MRRIVLLILASSLTVLSCHIFCSSTKIEIVEVCEKDKHAYANTIQYLVINYKDDRSMIDSTALEILCGMKDSIESMTSRINISFYKKTSRMTKDVLHCRPNVMFYNPEVDNIAHYVYERDKPYLKAYYRQGSEYDIELGRLPINCGSHD